MAHNDRLAERDGRRADIDEAEADVLARESRDPLLLVEAALAHPAVFKDVARSLDTCEPNARAARRLVRAHDEEAAPSWLVAFLLGKVRHADGYPKVLEILRRGDRQLSESYAATSAVHIAGAGAAPDLENVIDTTDGLPKKAAARGLVAIATPRALAFLVAATSRGRLAAMTVGNALAAVAVDPDVMTASLRSAHRETRRWPAFTISARLRHPQPERHAAELRRCGSSIELRAALRDVIDEPGETVWEADAAKIRQWLDSLG